MSDLVGRFHAHVYIEYSENLPRVKGWKQTRIELVKGDRSQKDLMFTRHFQVPSRRNPDFATVQKRVIDFSNKLRQEVLRVKIEHQEFKTLPISPENYREYHYLFLRSSEDSLPPILEGWVLSRNLDNTDPKLLFYNKRVRHGNIKEQDAKAFNEAMSLEGVSLEGFKEETVVYDSNPDMDSWWA